MHVDPDFRQEGKERSQESKGEFPQPLTLSSHPPLFSRHWDPKNVYFD